MTRVRASALILALPLLGGCVVPIPLGATTVVTTTETITPESSGSFGTEAEQPTGAAAHVYYDEVEDPYQQAVRCAASQEALLRLNTYMVTRQSLYDMQDSIWMWTNLAIERGGEHGVSEGQTRADIARLSATLHGREANRVALTCVAAEE